jgi:hypothetical protein
MGQNHLFRRFYPVATLSGLCPGFVGYSAANGYAFESIRCIFAAGGIWHDAHLLRIPQTWLA